VARSDPDLETGVGKEGSGMTTVFGLLRFVVALINSMLFASMELVIIAFRRSDRTFHALARGWAHSTLRICGVRVQVKGLQQLQPGRNYVYVSNHASMFDIPVILASIPDQIRIIYKKELQWIPIFGWGLKFGSYISVDRSRGTEAMRSLDAAAEKIARGASVLLYAEGTRTHDGQLQPFKRGAFNLAVKAGVPVVPLTVNGSFTILPRASLAIRPGTVGLVIESPIPITGAGKDEEKRLMDLVRAAMDRHYVNQDEGAFSP
jgi:1-acyl-sn-glycerol-3-phosphate acyltransferase